MKYLKLFEDYSNGLEFKNWFKNSKMVDDNNNPKIYYHGIGKFDRFDTFKKEFISAASGNYGHFGKGFYFTDSKSAAEIFSYFVGGKGEYLEVYLKITNPFILTEKKLIDICIKHNIDLPNKEIISLDSDSIYYQLLKIDIVCAELFKLIIDNGYSKGWELFKLKYDNKIPDTKIDLNLITDFAELNPIYIDEMKLNNIEPKLIYDYAEPIRMDYLTNLGQTPDEITDAIKKEGFDGIIADDEIVVFEPNQIKSIYNKGGYSSSDDNIYEKLK